MKSDDIEKAYKKLKELKPDYFPDTLIPQSKEHWKKHYPEWFDE
jgi:hypothetical protein